MKIGFIGCGNMASAMIGGILRQGIFSKDEIIVSNLTDEGRARSEKTLGVVTTLDNNEIVRSAKTVVLAVKPQFYEEVLTEVHDSLTTEHTIIGIAPGKTLAWLEEKAGLPLKVVRFMPNTPAQVGAGMTAVCTNDRVSEDELAEILKITDSFGCTEVIPERLMDAAGAVGGCSPAYVFMFIEAMADAAVSQGMPRKQAYKFASQTVLGSAKMVLETGRHPGDLKDMVCSPAGTTSLWQNGSLYDLHHIFPRNQTELLCPVLLSFYFPKLQTAGSWENPGKADILFPEGLFSAS